jgi:hypothetical protein
VIQVALSRIQMKLSTEKQIKTKQTNKQTNKNKKKTKAKTTITKTKQNKIKHLTIYESLKLICTCKWSIHLLVLIMSYFPYDGKNGTRSTCSKSNGISRH